MDYNKLVQVLLLEQKQRALYREDILSDTTDVALGIGGLIPGIGEVFDITLAIRFAKRSEYLNAALCLISCIPVIGDVVGKGTLIANFLAKLARYTRARGKVGRLTAKTLIGTRNIAQHTSPVILDLKRKILKNKYVIKELFNRAKKHNNLKQYADKMEEALYAFLKEPKNYTLSSREESSLD